MNLDNTIYIYIYIYYDLFEEWVVYLGSGLKTSVRPDKMCLTKSFTAKVSLKL